jgi:biopolymer transport protein ExbD
MSANSSEGAEPNLTPILDMVFQLITFFMLVINFKGASLDFSLKLPVLGSARPMDYRGQDEPLLLNVTGDGKVLAYGREVDAETFLSQEAKFLKTRLMLGGVKEKDVELTVPVVVRADRAVDFATLNRILKLCQAQGFRQFSLSAMTREEGR